MKLVLLAWGGGGGFVCLEGRVDSEHMSEVQTVRLSIGAF